MSWSTTNTSSFSSATSTVNGAKTGGSRSTSHGMFFHQPFLKHLCPKVRAQSSNDLCDNNASPFFAHCKFRTPRSVTRFNCDFTFGGVW